jgi:diaminohydroxyphosphoribosylaminopyrimidine deaminase / 5-amino-6-(5-phosphoribosylamino)uracil reductase
MHRCLELARLGKGAVAPNPLVGAVLVHNDRIIGEGFHARYGEAHAEVNCISSVLEADKGLIAQSTLYVSLEPCAHFGKTPPCTELIIKYKIPKVVIGCADPFKEVDGKGIAQLQGAGIEVILDVLGAECREINRRFFTWLTLNRPYVILKWAQSSNHKIARLDFTPVKISNACTDRLVHKWRSEEASILVGTNTAQFDDPALTNRHWSGPSPVRLVVDMELSLPVSLRLFNQEVSTIVFNGKRHDVEGQILYYQVTDHTQLVQQMLNGLSHFNIQSVIVEGGAKLLQSFIDCGCWDEARIITNTELLIENGLPAPELDGARYIDSQEIFTDRIDYYRKKEAV